jgi:hypothetical protein
VFGNQTFMVIIALALWPIACAAALLSMERRKAVIYLMVFGWMFMPDFSKDTLPFIHSKAGYLPGVLLFASLTLDSGRWLKLRRSMFDVPVIAYPLCAAVSSLVNGYGAWDAFNQSINSALGWTAPYFLGRVYLGDLAGLRDLAIGFVFGSLVYVPLCLFEIRMSPQLKYLVYGTQGVFAQMVRAGGYRPQVFMSHGLMLSFWMGMSAVAAWWLWRSRAVSRIGRVPIKWAALVLLGTTVLCKSTGALVFTGVGILLYPTSRWLRTSLPVIALLAIPPAYCMLRVNGWSGADLVSSASELFSSARGESLDFRVRNEDALIDRAIRKPLFGWGRWGASRVRDAEGRDVSVTDGLWIIVLGYDGTLALLCLALAMSLPVALLLMMSPPQAWTRASLAPAGALALALAFAWIDCIPNSMLTPLSLLGGGGLTGVYLAARAAARAKLPRRRGRPGMLQPQPVLS